MFQFLAPWTVKDIQGMIIHDFKAYERAHMTQLRQLLTIVIRKDMCTQLLFCSIQRDVSDVPFDFF